MSNLEPRLVTPIYAKLEARMDWPPDKAFYLLTATDLFLCRNHPFFDSCVPAPRWPTELAPQGAFLKVRYPKVPQPMLEHVIGFFSCVADASSAEAAVLLAWDSVFERLRVIVPEQLATVSRNSWGDDSPIGLHYETPAGLPAGWTLIGDIHSHVDYAPYSSYVDQHDEQHRPGLHVVVGRIAREPPEFHAEAVVDGTRFQVASELVLAGYQRRRSRFPRSWIKKVKVKVYGPANYGRKDKYGGTYLVGVQKPGAASGAPKPVAGGNSQKPSAGSWTGAGSGSKRLEATDGARREDAADQPLPPEGCA